MPEIVEVEFLRRVMEKAWVGTKPETWIGSLKYIEGYTPQQFQTFWLQPGLKITKVERYGKFLWFRLGDWYVWQVHLGSTGWFLPENERAKKAAGDEIEGREFLHSTGPKALRTTLVMGDGQIWSYRDSRTWGKWSILSDLGEIQDYFLKRKGWGPDWLLTPEKAAEALFRAFLTRAKPVKEILTDQSITSGLGNYLACEITARAGVLPFRESTSLSLEERRAIIQAVEPMLEISMSTLDHAHWVVFKRKKCGMCGKEVSYVKDRNATRGSYFCKSCQT